MQSATILIDRVQELIKDGSFGPSFIVEKLNDGLAEVVRMTTPPDLVEMDVELEVYAGEKFVEMPENFYGPRLLKLHNATDDQPCLVVYRLVDFAHLCRRYSSTAIRAACLKGRKLLVTGIPAATTMLYATYLREPEIFSGEGDSGKNIGYLPFRLGEQAIVSYAAWRIYQHIEDGIDGKKVNSESFHADFLDATAKIMDHFGMEAREKEPERVPDLMGISNDRSSSFIDNMEGL